MASGNKIEAGEYKTTVIDGVEAARHRAMFDQIETNWDLLEDAATVLRFAKIAPSIVKWLGGMLALGAIVGAAAKLYGLAP